MSDMENDAPISELFLVICDWAIALNAGEISKLPGVWSHELGKFVISINAHREPMKDPQGLEVPPLSASVHAPKYLGAVMIVGAFGGVGAPGMEDDVIAALKADTARLREAA